VTTLADDGTIMSDSGPRREFHASHRVQRTPPKQGTDPAEAPEM
jgi:hypothetical protein